MTGGAVTGGPRKPVRPAAPRPETDLSQRPRYVWAGRIGALALRLWGRTLHWTWDVPESVRALEKEGGLVIWTFWHAHILPLTYAWRGRDTAVLVSRHGDGEIISQILHRIGYGTVRGSSTRGGLRALLEMARLGRAGVPLAVTPDGPRGPRRVLQPGVLVISQRSGLPILPMSVGMRRGRVLDSWDQFRLPAFFSRVFVALGEPILVDPDADPDALATIWGPRVQRALDELDARAARWEAGEPLGSDGTGHAWGIGVLRELSRDVK